MATLIHSNSTSEQKRCSDIWLSGNIEEEKTIDCDWGLAKLAEYFGKMEALTTYWDGATKEENGDISGAISLYKKAFKMWPSLDSIQCGGLPKGIREEAEEAGFKCDIDIIEVPMARKSEVMKCSKLLSIDDIADVTTVKDFILTKETVLENNSQNNTHFKKTCIFLNNPPQCYGRNCLPHILHKMINFAKNAWIEAKWSGTNEAPGPLYAIKGGIRELSIRVVEYWNYQSQGGLVDPYHLDTDSVLTIVALLSHESEYTGGVFRTNEVEDIELEHCMSQGDVICFISHKYHNITPLLTGCRKSLVIELWQGGVGHEGR